ncbi:phosphoserine phosphatase SerB [Euzebya tangerina]|uniref:phosphoserine phosphatase SerB n=1 Tax=Euzebya tangerina TaxID=591198 RepID=UPI00196AC743|nr:phosphoserine phosphatase SerB [Euzebya tangerina]
MDNAAALLITVTGRDRPGLTTELCAALADAEARILDMEQVVIQDRLVLGILAVPPADIEPLRTRIAAIGAAKGVTCELEQVARHRRSHRDPQQMHHVNILGQPLRPQAIADITAQIAAVGGNIDRIERLSRYPVLSFELLVSGVADTQELNRVIGPVAAAARVDVAVQRAGLYRRAKRLIVFDVDSTLVDGEVIEMLAEHTGCAGEVQAVTARAMAGELDFEESLRTRVALLEGCPAEALDDVRRDLRLMPGARTILRTLSRLGYVTAMVSGGFDAITDPLARELGVDYTYANTLEVEDGRLTGRLVGPIVDRRAKAKLLESVAVEAGVPLSQTVAVGDGANDLDMLSAAGLGIAFNAKPVVQEQAEVAVNVPYLDAVLFMLGLTREEIERADADDPDIDLPEPPAVPEA